VEHCVFRIQKPIGRALRNPCFGRTDHTHHTMVSGGQQGRGPFDGSISTVGLLCHCFELQDLATELML